MVYTPYDPHSVTMESVGAVQDTNVRHKADIVAAADGIEEVALSEWKLKG